MPFTQENEIMALNRHDFVQADSLADYICDYLDGEMDQTIREVFEEYLATQTELTEFINTANSGKKALEILKDFNSEGDGQ